MSINCKIKLYFFGEAMDLLVNKIKTDGKIYPGNILKVDGFLNHQIDPQLMNAIGDEIYRLYKDEMVTKIMTIEASGIAIALAAAMKFNVPMLFAKKSQSKNISPSVYSTKVTSFTHGRVYDVMVSRDYLTADDRVLIVDDFLANGIALKGLINLVDQAGATLAGCAIAIEKGFQSGGKLLRDSGVRIESLAVIKNMTDDGRLEFENNAE